MICYRFNSVSTVIYYDTTTTKQSTQYTATAQTTTSESETAEDDHSGEAVIESTLGYVVDGYSFGVNGRTTGAYSYKNIWTQQNTKASTQNATITIYSPLVSADTPVPTPFWYSQITYAAPLLFIRSQGLRGDLERAHPPPCACSKWYSRVRRRWTEEGSHCFAATANYRCVPGAVGRLSQ